VVGTRTMHIEMSQRRIPISGVISGLVFLAKEVTLAILLTSAFARPTTGDSRIEPQPSGPPETVTNR
jgi:hypothetical protein